MKTVAHLQAEGFTVRPAQDAVGCTEVLSKKPFWYYNPRFHSDMASIQANLKAADTNGETFRLLSAGTFAAAEHFPFALISDEAKRALDFAFEEYSRKMGEARTAAETYMATVTGSVVPA